MRTIAVLGLAAMLACGAARGAGDPALVPEIDRLVPDSGPAGTAYPVEVTIVGRHFADSNIVTFGPLSIPALPSTERGTRIVFLAPKETPSPGEVPPAPLSPGAYDVRVATGGGISNAVAFTLTREPGARR